MIIILDLLILLVSFIILFNIRVGFVLALMVKILVPSVVRLQLGPISLAIGDVLVSALLISFLCHREKIKATMPSKLGKYFSIYTLSVPVLIICSTAFVPYSFQFLSYFKGFLFQTILYIIIGYYVLNKSNIKSVINVLCVCSLMSGLYGIFSYAVGNNAYVGALNLLYGSEDIFAYFMEEERGGLQGRTYGTMGHPLAWGQYWNIFLCAVWILKKHINRYLFVFIVCIGLINIILCGSRTAIVTFGVFLLFVLLDYGIKRLLIIIPSVYLIVIVCLSIIPQNYKKSGIIQYVESGIFFWDNSYSEKAGITGSDKQMRIIQLQKSMGVMEKNPIGGVGYNYQYYVLQSNRVIADGLFGLESIVFKLLVEQGIVGLLVFFYTYNILRKYALSISNINRRKVLINGYFASFLTSMCFTGIQGASYTYFMIFLFLIIFNTDKNDTENNSLLLVWGQSPASECEEVHSLVEKISPRL